jgi:hypothetical protein
MRNDEHMGGGRKMHKFRVGDIVNFMPEVHLDEVKPGPDVEVLELFDYLDCGRGMIQSGPHYLVECLPSGDHTSLVLRVIIRQRERRLVAEADLRTHQELAACEEKAAAYRAATRARCEVFSRVTRELGAGGGVEAHLRADRGGRLDVQLESEAAAVAFARAVLKVLAAGERTGPE